MFKGLKDMGSLMKQASEMKSKMADIQKNLKKMIFSAEALSGKLKITVNGELEIVDVSLDQAALNEKPANLEKAIKEATNNALKSAKDAAASQLSAITGGLNLPGF
jgi:DNA-binding YbaB/EbfC family protein